MRLSPRGIKRVTWREDFFPTLESPALRDETSPTELGGGERSRKHLDPVGFCWQPLSGRRWQLAISASRRSSPAAWLAALAPLRPAGSRLWETPSSCWPGGLPEGCGAPRRRCPWANAAWGGADEGRTESTCGQASSAPIWCWGSRRQDERSWRSKTEMGRSTPRWTSWEQQVKVLVNGTFTPQGHHPAESLILVKCPVQCWTIPSPCPLIVCLFVFCNLSR